MPVTFPETPPINSQPVQIDTQTQIKRPKLLNIYNRDTSAFNRLPSNRIDTNAYDGFIDRAPKTTSTSTTTTPNPYQQKADNGNDDISPLTNDLVEERHGHRNRRRRPCIPVYNNHPAYRSNQKGSGRTLWDLHFYLNSIYPNTYGGSETGTYGGSNGGDSGSFVDNRPVYDHYGGYECIPNPHYTGHRPHHHNQHHNNNHHGSYAGSHHGSSSGTGSGGGYDGVQEDDYNRPGGGPLGFFGSGGLFDFFSGLVGGGGGGGGGNVPVVSRPPNNGRPPLITPGSQSDPPIYNDDEIKPVFEINVHDTVQNLVD